MAEEGITKRIDAITIIPPEYRVPAPPAPRSVKIELTARCDFKCFYCASSFRLRSKADMDQDFYRRIVREMREAGVEELGVFYLGESFLCSWLPEAIRYAKEDCGYPYVFLTTNGRMASMERVEACIRAGLDSLKFSFNYTTPEQFSEVTRTPARGYRAVVDNIKAAREVRDKVERETGHRCGLYVSSIRYDGEQQKRMEWLAGKISRLVDQHYWLPLYNQAGLVSEATKDKEGAVAGNTGRYDAMRAPVPCWATMTEGHIVYDGKLSACCFDHDGRFHMGDLTKESFMDAWHSEKFQALRKAHLDGDVKGTPCEKCIAYQ